MKTLEEVKGRLRFAKRVKCLGKDEWFNLCDRYGKQLDCEYIESAMERGRYIIIFNEAQDVNDCPGVGYHSCVIHNEDGVTAEIEYYPSIDELEEVEPSKPQRYASREVSGMDVIDLVEHWNLSFSEGNILKYLLRKKGEDISDLEKIIDYANRRIEQLKTK